MLHEDEKGRSIPTIATLQEYARDIAPFVIEAGYSMADHNAERSTDHDEACRIAIEDHFQLSLATLNPSSLELLGTLLRLETSAAWANEFPNNIAP